MSGIFFHDKGCSTIDLSTYIFISKISNSKQLWSFTLTKKDYVNEIQNIVYTWHNYIEYIPI